MSRPLPNLHVRDVRVDRFESLSGDADFCSREMRMRDQVHEHRSYRIEPGGGAGSTAALAALDVAVGQGDLFTVCLALAAPRFFRSGV